MITRIAYELDPSATITKHADAETLSPGLAGGIPVYTYTEAQKLKQENIPVLFVVTDKIESRNDFLKALGNNFLQGALLLFGNFSTHLATICRKQKLPAIRIFTETPFSTDEPLIIEKDSLYSGPLQALRPVGLTSLGKLPGIIAQYTPLITALTKELTYERRFAIYSKALALQDLIAPNNAEEREIIISLIHDQVVDTSSLSRKEIKTQALRRAFVLKSGFRYKQYTLDKYIFTETFFNEIFKNTILPGTPEEIITSWLEPLSLERKTPHAELFSKHLVLGYEQVLGEVWDTAYEKDKAVRTPAAQQNQKLYEILCALFPEEKNNISYYTNTYRYTYGIHDSHTEYRNIQVSAVLCPPTLKEKIMQNAAKILQLW